MKPTDTSPFSRTAMSAQRQTPLNVTFDKGWKTESHRQALVTLVANSPCAWLLRPFQGFPAAPSKAMIFSALTLCARGPPLSKASTQHPSGVRATLGGQSPSSSVRAW